MSQTAVIAWRNIWRNKRRTIITGTAIAFSAAILIFFIGLQRSSYSAAIQATTSIFQGHFQIMLPSYKEDGNIRDSFAHGEVLRNKLLTLPHISEISLRSEGFAILSSKSRTFGAKILGVHPEEEKALSTIPSLVQTGAYLTSSHAQELVLGRTLARNLRVQVGDEVTLLGQGKDGSTAAALLKVQGIFESGSLDLDRSLLEIPIETFREIFSLGEMRHEEVHLMAARVDNIAETDSVVKSLNNYFKEQHLPLQAYTWNEITPGLKQAIDLDMASGWLFYLSLIVIVVFGVLNTFLMSILERTKEFGMLLAVGMSPRSIITLILIESIFLLLVGIVPGIMLGAATLFYFHIYGFSIPGTEEAMKMWNLPAAIHPEVTFLHLSLGPAILFLFALILLVPFTFRILKLEPLEAMRGV
ncbi:MAG: ABC transporter permease [Bdellovibrionales bacterium]|nr:ABC transporter permease [Bdellovibrionales bacterium]